jgi:16S rRNA (guanine966-N2)-methyltransferase
VRIITGRYKGAILRTIKGDSVRPTQDRVREALFSILGDKVVGATVLDLYAGSGGLGLEALSRGAVSCTFVERSRPVAAVLQENIDRIGAQNCRVFTAPTDRALPRLAADGIRFDIVFMDPPYGKDLVPTTMQRLGHHKLLNSQGRVVAEHEYRNALPTEIPPFYRIDTRRYGDSSFTIYTPLLDKEIR